LSWELNDVLLSPRTERAVRFSPLPPVLGESCVKKSEINSLRVWIWREESSTGEAFGVVKWNMEHMVMRLLQVQTYQTAPVLRNFLWRYGVIITAAQPRSQRNDLLQ